MATKKRRVRREAIDMEHAGPVPDRISFGNCNRCGKDHAGLWLHPFPTTVYPPRSTQEASHYVICPRTSRIVYITWIEP